MKMPQPSDYRKRAEECVQLAQTVRTPEQRTMLLHIAETWLRLARGADPQFDERRRQSDGREQSSAMN